MTLSQTAQSCIQHLDCIESPKGSGTVVISGDRYPTDAKAEVESYLEHLGMIVDSSDEYRTRVHNTSTILIFELFLVFEN